MHDPDGTTARLNVGVVEAPRFLDEVLKALLHGYTQGQASRLLSPHELRDAYQLLLHLSKIKLQAVEEDR